MAVVLLEMATFKLRKFVSFLKVLRNLLTNSKIFSFSNYDMFWNTYLDLEKLVMENSTYLSTSLGTLSYTMCASMSVVM